MELPERFIVRAVSEPNDEVGRLVETFAEYELAIAALEPHPIAPSTAGIMTRTDFGVVSMQLRLPPGAVRRPSKDLDVWDWADQSAILLALFQPEFPRIVNQLAAPTRSLRLGDRLVGLDFTDDADRPRYTATIKGVLSDEVEMLAMVGGPTAEHREALIRALLTLESAG